MSCDTYFYELGKRFYLLPSDRGHPLQGWAHRLGLGDRTLVDVGPEVAGLIPTPEWRCKAYRGPPRARGVGRLLKPGDSMPKAIGHGPNPPNPPPHERPPPPRPHPPRMRPPPPR